MKNTPKQQTAPIHTSDNRYDLMKRLAHLDAWNHMDRAERYRRTAAFVAFNARTCMTVVDLLRFQRSALQESIIERLMGDVARQYEETFGLAAPWLEPTTEAGIRGIVVEEV